MTLDTFSITLAKEYLGEDAYEHLRNLIQESSLRAPMLLSILKELGQEIGHEINRTRIYEKMIDKLLSRETGLQTIQSNFASPYPSVIFLSREVKLVEMPEFTG